MRALLFSIAVLTVSPALAAPPSPFWFEQMEEEVGTPDIGSSDVENARLSWRDLPEAAPICHFSAEDCAEFDMTDPEDVDWLQTLNYLAYLEAQSAEIDMMLYGQPYSTLTQEQRDAMDAEDADE